MSLLKFTSVRFCRFHWIHDSCHLNEQRWFKTNKCTCFGEGTCVECECNLTDGERAPRLPLAGSKEASGDVEWVQTPIPFVEGAATPSATPIATPSSSSSSTSSSSKPALVQTVLKFGATTKPAMAANDSIYMLGTSSDEDGHSPW
jgi:hypothetical protein